MSTDLSTWVPDLEPETDPERLEHLFAIAARMRQSWEVVRQQIQDKHPYADWYPHKKQAELWYDNAKILTVSAANRWGKSNFGLSRDCFIATGMPPEFFLDPVRVPYMRHLPWPVKKGPHRLWIVTPDADKRESTLAAPMLNEHMGEVHKRDSHPWIPRAMVKRVIRDRSKRVKTILTATAELHFISQDQKIKKVMSEPIDGFHIDEELYGDDAKMWLTELQARLLDRRGRGWITLTAVESARSPLPTPLVTDIIKPGLEGRLDPRIYSVHTGHIDDNTHMSVEEREEAKAQFLDEYGDPTPDYYLRICGEITSLAGSKFFHGQSIHYQKELNVQPPALVGGLDDEIHWVRVKGAPGRLRPTKLNPRQVKFRRDPRGSLNIWHPPSERHQYSIGVDCAHGTPGGNPTCAVVYNRSTRRFDAMLWGLIDPTLMMYWVIKLATYYNMAWVCVEDEDQGITLNSYLAGKEIQKERYPYLYHHMGQNGGVAKKPGLPMNEGEKIWMLDNLAATITPQNKLDPQSALVRVPILRILDEMTMVAKDERGKIVYGKKKTGKVVTHCDTVVAAGLAIITANSPLCPPHGLLAGDEPLPEDPKQRLFEEAYRKDQKEQREGDGSVVEITPFEDEELTPFQAW